MRLFLQLLLSGCELLMVDLQVVPVEGVLFPCCDSGGNTLQNWQFQLSRLSTLLTKTWYSRSVNRNEFLRPLVRFYKAIEVSAANTSGFSEKQAFLNKSL